MNGPAVLLVAVFVVMLVLPFVPGLCEIYRPRDRYPLPVDLDFARDPRHLGRRLRALLRAALADASQRPEGVHDVVLSKPDRVRVTDDLQLAAGARAADVLFVRGALRADPGARLDDDAYVLGAADLAEGCRARTLACDGDVRLGRGTVIERWVDADGDVRVAEGCDLGVHCATAGGLRLADDVRFARLFAEPVVTPGGAAREVAALPDDLPRLPRPRGPRTRLTACIDARLAWREGDLTVAAGARHADDVVVRGRLRLARGAQLRGQVRAYGDVVLEEGATLDGDLFADGDVTLGDGAAVTGSVFSQATVSVGRGVQIGRPGHVKSLVGNRGVVLGPAVVVHGQVLAQANGRVACPARS